MDILYARCAGLDIHRDTIVACVRLAEAGGVIRLVETFATTTAELERLSEWPAMVSYQRAFALTHWGEARSARSA